MNVFLWCGPVSASNLASVRWRVPTQVVTVNHRDWPGAQQGPARPEITGSSAFGTLAARMGARPLSRILELAGVRSADKVGIGGFSAAHGLLNPILSSPDAAIVSCLGAFDAYFTGANKAIKQGYLRFCERAKAGEVLAAVTTSSNGDATTPPADASFRILAESVGIEPVAAPPGVPEPEEMLGAGLFGWANYGKRFSHIGHATQLAAPWIDAVIAPYMAGETVALGGSSAAAGFPWGRALFGIATLGAIALVAEELA